MWLFRKRREAKQDLPEKHVVATKLGKVIVKLQTTFAERLNEAASKVPVKELKRNLFIFCLVGGGVSIYVAIHALTDDPVKTNPLHIDQASVPKHFDKSGDEVKDLGQPIDDGVYQQIKAFRLYVDSLRRVDKPAYDSLLSARPGLMDSIRVLEEIYLSKTIK